MHIYFRTVTHLFVVQPSGERENARLRIQRENVVGPIGDHRVRDERIGAQIRIGCRNDADLMAALGALRDVKRVGGLREYGRIVVGVGDLESGRTENNLALEYECN